MSLRSTYPTRDRRVIRETRRSIDTCLRRRLAKNLTQPGRDDLVLAWDFTTASDALVRSSMLTARDAAMPAMGDLGVNLSYQINKDEPYGDGTQISRRVLGTFQTPLFLTDDASDNSVMAAETATPSRP